MFVQSMRSLVLDGGSDATAAAGKNDATEVSLCRQMMVTASPILCEAIRKSYMNMCSTAALGRLAAATTEELPTVDTTDIKESTYSCPKSFYNCPESAFPLIITFSDYVRMLDRGLSAPFFGTKVTVGQSLEVDFHRFTQVYFPHMDEKLRQQVDSAMMYTEIMTHIKGSVLAMKTAKGELSLEQYVALAQLRNNTIDVPKRERIYEAYIKYERLKNQEHGDYDMIDVVHHVYQALSREPYNGVSITQVYVDEVQDLSPAQIMLLKFVCHNSDGYVLAGDTAQTVSSPFHCSNFISSTTTARLQV